MTLGSVPLSDLMRDVIESAVPLADGYRVTVTTATHRHTYRSNARTWYCAWQEAVDKYGIPSVVSVKPIYDEKPEERPQLCLIA